MIFKVQPQSYLKGKISLPASKSYSIRAYIIAACGGRSFIRNPSDCDDVVVARSIARAFGSKIQRQGNNDWIVESFAKKVNPSIIEVKESGTSLRFVMPLCAIYTNRARIEGTGTLLGRPNLFLTQALREMGVHIRGTGKEESVPITLVGGNIRGGDIVIDGSVSSQFISALLIACPQLEGQTRLRLRGDKLVSLDYITMTEQILKESGVIIKRRDKRNFVIDGGQKFKGFKSFYVPSDYGLAAFHLVAAALVKSNVVLKGVFRDKFIQADGQIIPLLKRMGVMFQQTSRSIRIRGSFVIKGGIFSLKDCPDLVPIMAVLALFADKKTILSNIKHARVKESDRIGDLRKELLKIGAKIKETEDSLIVHPQDVYKKDILLDPHKDHRLAMAFSVLGLKVGVRIKDIECCSKSYPNFTKDFQMICS